MSLSKSNRCKIVLIGDYMSGKTKWINEILGTSKSTTYVPTLGVDVFPVPMEDYIFDIWDTAGQEQYGGLKEGYYIGAQIGVVFGENTEPWIENFKKYCPNAFIIIANNHTSTSILPTILELYK
jgi:GTP-binding nuclear protein Ran